MAVDERGFAPYTNRRRVFPLMKAAVLFTFVLLSTTFAQADFSYTTTSRATGGMAASLGGASNNPPAKQYFKGQKMKTDIGDTAIIIDFDAQTMTTINNRAKTVSVRSLSDAAPAGQSGVSVKIDVKETGQQKTINGYNCKEVVMTMDVDIPQAQQMGKMQMEMDLWLSPDVPGIGELRSFYKKNMDKFPWASLSGGGNQGGMQAGIAQLQRKIAEVGGVQVESVMKVKPAGGAGAPAMPQMSAAQQAQMAAAMEKLKAMQSQGGPAAAAAAQAMARMGGVASPGGASSSLMEITTDASDFSTASIPDSVFAIPAGYQKVDAK
jgi:hypothetical protein